MHKRLLILGTRGVPAQHGGFETFAEHLSQYLVQKDWRVTVYCQEPWERTSIYETMWGRVRRVHIPVKQKGALGTMVFDLKAVLHARKQATMSLTLGYNTALFNLLQTARRKANVFNMDGLEYAREKWGTFAKLWLILNERIATRFGTHLVADHPEIKAHLARRTSEQRITMIPYGADMIADASAEPVRDLGLEPGKYSTVICRPEPENSLLEIVEGFSREPRGHTLVVLGDFDDSKPYHKQVLEAASDEVLFTGAIYDKSVLTSLRFHSYLYVHGHTVGGTNPSLVEALAAGNPVLAHDNRFNRWVAGNEAAEYFTDADSCAAQFSTLLAKPDLTHSMRKAARLRHADCFTWEQVLADYEKMLNRYNPYAPDPEGWEKYLDE